MILMQKMYLPDDLAAVPLRVMLAMPEPLCCAHVTQYLGEATEIEVVGRTAAESEAMQLFFRLRPDVTVLDWRIAMHEPARLVGMLKRVAPGACVVSVVPALDSMPARAARALGADEVVTCDSLPQCLSTLAEHLERVRHH
ncbi:two-component system response regulator [Azoarcus olearius]|uniref:Hypothetical two-component system response regulator n=1 Tax=Azoarcus sp. (strain BH72) TaxID=418699 RepID=A1K337_AZOSB|nr:two-component system response regulator [Azoarcus olearius]ANQ83769.1 two-component system response regulator [Azoarcus olearius]CAL93242.1 hypothetical two-component system response regulator [Azoarcus olearius]